MSAPDWEQLERYLAGECGPAERELIERWLAVAPGRRAVLEELRLQVIGEEGVPLVVGWGREEVRARLDQEMARSGAVVSASGSLPRHAAKARVSASLIPANRRPWTGAFQTAALVVAFVGAGTAAWHVLRPAARPAAEAEPSFHLVSAPRGQRLGLRLADGTAVTLAPGSTLRIPSSYGGKSRDVSLEGEAMFTVSHDVSRPFAVHTARVIARDLGTEFVVRAYEDAPTTDVVVSRGLVAVGRAPTPGLSASGTSGSGFGGLPLTPDSIVIGRGERVRAGDDGGLALTRSVALDRYFAWTEGRLVFRDTPLRDVVAQLGRWYDADISLGSPAMADRPLTASFTDEPLSETLRVTAAALGVVVVKRGSGYVLVTPPSSSAGPATR